MTTTTRPKIVVLCGSTRFRDAIRDTGRTESLNGHIVLGSWSFSHAEGVQLTDEQAHAMTVAHHHMIAMADEVLIVAPGGYIGAATRGEMELAEQHSKPVRVLTGGAP